MRIVKSVISITVLAIMSIIIASGVGAVFSKPEPKSVFQMSKTEYLATAVDNCSVDNPAIYCWCFYSGMLDKYSVAEVLQLDAALTASPDYQASDEQIRLAAKCIGEV